MSERFSLLLRSLPCRQTSMALSGRSVRVQDGKCPPSLLQGFSGHGRKFTSAGRQFLANRPTRNGSASENLFWPAKALPSSIFAEVTHPSGSSTFGH